MPRSIRLRFLVPPGNPTVEPEMTRLAPPGVTVHFTRMVAHGEAGSHEGQEERNRSQIAHLDENVALLAMVKPVVMAHTAWTSPPGAIWNALRVADVDAPITGYGSLLSKRGDS